MRFERSLDGRVFPFTLYYRSRVLKVTNLYDFIEHTKHQVESGKYQRLRTLIVHCTLKLYDFYNSAS